LDKDLQAKAKFRADGIARNVTEFDRDGRSCPVCVKLIQVLLIKQALKQSRSEIAVE
jgi:hypothetical protein